MNEKIIENIEKMQDNKEKLREYLTELKNRGVLTQGQVNMILEEAENDAITSSKTGTRTPKTMEYAYSNVSAGFSSTGMLMLLALSVPALVGMVAMLNKEIKIKEVYKK